DGEDRPLGADAEDDREEEHEQEPGEGDHDVDQRTDESPDPASEQQGSRAEQQADDGRADGGGDGQQDGEAGGDEHAVEQVASEGVGPQPVLPRGPGEDVGGVDGVRATVPEDRCEDGQEDHDREEGQAHQPDGRAHRATPATGAHASPIVERGSRTAMATSTSVLMTRTSTPYTSTIPCTTG